MAQFHSPKIVTDGLVLALDAANRDSYPGSGTVWTDLSGNGNNGTLTNGPTFSSGNGGGLVFDGVDDSVEINHNVLLNPTLSMTISVWVKLQFLPVDLSGGAPFCGKGTQTSGQGGFDFRISAPVVGSTYRLNLVKYFVADQNVNIPVPLLIDTWYNFTAVQSSDRVTYYMNGESIGFFLNSTNYQTNTTNFRLGVNREVVNVPRFYLDGEIPYLLFYKKILTAAEVLQNYNATKGRYGL